MRIPSVKHWVVLCLCFQTPICAQIGAGVRSGPPTLSFKELISAAEMDPPPPALQRKMDALFNTPFIDNSAAGTGAPSSRVSSPVLHVAEWNIYRAPDDEDAKNALANPEALIEKARHNPQFDRRNLSALSEQLEVLQKADIVILNEIDDGVDREHYHNVPRELGAALHMNSAFAVEFLELNRIYLGAHKMDVVDNKHVDRDNNFGLDPNRYLGLEGTALLSRYPIRSARIIHLPEEYDWYHGEIGAVSDLEKVRRWTSEQVFEERIKRQVRRGGRLALIVELAVPGEPGGILTVVCPHLEDYCAPKGRRRQMDYLLTQIRDLKGPVLVGGDLNTLGHNGRPLTVGGLVHRYLLNYHFWAREAFYFFLPVPGAGEIAHAINYVKNLYDPTAVNVPILLSNPERHLFKDTRSFRFDDGSRLDFSGDRELSYGHRGNTLADSAQRKWKGFVPSFTFEKTYGGLVGEFKLDWLFVKTQAQGPGQVPAPQFGRTLTFVNQAVVPRISPHSPTELEVRLESATSAQGSETRHH